MAIRDFTRPARGAFLTKSAPNATPRPLSPAIRERLQKLLLMLSSDHDGERAAATSAIDRILKAEGRDWHDLAGAIVAPAPPSPPPRASPPPPSPPSSSSSSQRRVPMPAGELRTRIRNLRAQRQFDPRSEGFLNSLASKAQRRNVVFLSLKQLKWLGDLSRKAGRSRGAA